MAVDTAASRSQFKLINGMDKFLERSYKGMADREEQNLMKHNFGKSSQRQLQISDVIKPNFAYREEHPRALNLHRQSKLNPMLDGSSKQKLPKPKVKTGGLDYKNIRKFLRETIKQM